jgi:nucleoside 2-deoxyribosyltransferase
MTTFAYFCGPFDQRARLLERAYELEDATKTTVQFTSSWLLGEHEAKEHDATEADMREWAAQDIEDIERAHVLVQFTDTPSTKGASHWEAGYAYGSGIEVVICGPVQHCFHALPGVTRFDTWPETLAWLIERQEVRG